MTLLFATFSLVSGPALLLCGPAADAVGPRPALRLSVLLAAAGSGCFVLADSPAWLFAGRVGQALALGAATGAAQALITWHRSPAARVGGPLLAGLAFAAGTAVGPAAGGLLAQYAPDPMVTPYLLHLILLAWMWRRLHRTLPEPTAVRRAQRRWRPSRPRIPAPVRPVFLVAGLNGFLAWAVVGIYLALVPSLLEQTPHGDSPALAGGVLGMVLVCSLLAQLAGARSRTRTAQGLGVAALTGSLILLAATGAASLPGTLGSALLAGAGHGLAFGGATRAVDARTPAGQRAGTGAALYLLFYLGSGTPAVVIGLMAACMPLPTAVARLSWAAAALGTLALAATFGRVDRDERGVPATGVAERAGAGAGCSSGIDDEVLRGVEQQSRILFRAASRGWMPPLCRMSTDPFSRVVIQEPHSPCPQEEGSVIPARAAASSTGVALSHSMVVPLRESSTANIVATPGPAAVPTSTGAADGPVGAAVAPKVSWWWRPIGKPAVASSSRTARI